MAGDLAFRAPSLIEPQGATDISMQACNGQFIVQ